MYAIDTVFNIYSAVLILLLMLGLLQFVTKIKAINYFSAGMLALFAGLRGFQVGLDTKNYVQHFYTQQLSGNTADGFERGYIILERLVIKMGGSPTTLFMVISIITLMLLAVFVTTNTEFGTFAIAYYYARYFLSRDLNQIRQSLASVIVLYSLKYIVEKKFVKFSIVILIAMQFHTAAIIMFPVYFIVGFFIESAEKGRIKRSIMLFLTTFIMSEVMSPVLSYVTGILGRGETYVTDTSNLGTSSMLTNVLIFNGFVVILLIFYMHRNGNEISNNVKNFIEVYFVGFSILLGLRNFPVAAARLASLVNTIEIVVFFQAMDALNVTKNKFVYVLLIMFLIIGVYYLNVVSGGSVIDYLPYTISIS